MDLWDVSHWIRCVLYSSELALRHNLETYFTLFFHSEDKLSRCRPTHEKLKFLPA